MTERQRRPCQQEALTCIETRRAAGETETNISMCTGAGKSQVICLATNSNARAVLIFPSLLLLQQYYKEWGMSYDLPHLYYLATEGRLEDTMKAMLSKPAKDVLRISDAMTELDSDRWILITTFASAPKLFAALGPTRVADIMCVDEAHHVTGAEYNEAVASITPYVRHTVHFSATLPESKQAHYKYPLLKGIRDSVVRDFNLELFICTLGERSETSLLITIVNKLRQWHTKVKLLIYTAQANTEGDDASSVKTFLSAHAEKMQKEGWWIKGINEDVSQKDREGLLRSFEKAPEDVAILVSCKTLSEGIDLKGANCMLPWDPTASVVDNIQRIGRVLRLYKKANGENADEQPPSTILIPVFLPEEEYLACNGDREAIDVLLSRQIGEGERGNFRPIVNVCTALKSEMAEEDAELFNQLLAYPYKPRVAVSRDLVECVAAAVKKPVDDVLNEVAEAIGEGDEVDEEMLDGVRDGEWTEEDAGAVANALAKSQGLTLVVRDGEETEQFGDGAKTLTVEKKVDGAFSVKRGGKEKKDTEAAKKRIAHRLRVDFSDGCRVLLGLESIEGADAAGGLVLSRLTAEVRVDEDWEKRRLEWVAMYEKLGRRPSQTAKEPDEKRAGQWQNNQRNNYRKGVLSEDRIHSLKETPGWVWGDNRWYDQYIQWIETFKRLGKEPSVLTTNETDRKVAIWQCRQRLRYKSKKLLSERLTILDNTDGWTWGNDDKWEKNRLQWVSVFQKLGRCPNKSSTNEEERRAASWQHDQRKYYKRGDSFLTEKRIKKLNTTPGWMWEEKDKWGEHHLLWISMYEKLGKTPSESSKDIDEKRAGQWQTLQRYNYKNNLMSQEKFNILEKTAGWKWITDNLWDSNLVHWIKMFNLYKRTPSHHSKDIEEKKAGAWQGHQRRNYKKKDPCMTPERIATLEATPGWSWSADEPPKTPFIADAPDTIQHVTDDAPVSTPHPFFRKRRVPKADGAPASTTTPTSRQRSQLEEYHKRFKSMNANTYAATIAESPADFTAYHTVADAYDARDPLERQPLNKIADKLAPNNKPSYHAVDLGCGMNRLRQHAAVARMSWTSVDVHAVDDTVVVADMGALPFEDETYDLAVLSRSLWARNHDVVLREVYRILKVGGRVIICESFQRWLDGKQNTLLTALRAAGFDIIQEEGTRVEDATEDVFQYIVARR